MFASTSRNGFSFKAYRGAQTNLLTIRGRAITPGGVILSSRRAVPDAIRLMCDYPAIRGRERGDS